MLIYSMSVSVDGFIKDRDGLFAWTVPTEEQFAFHLAQVRELGSFLCGRNVYETMLVWETDASLRSDPLHSAFAEAWTALPKVVFSRTREKVQGNARMATAPLADEIAIAVRSTEMPVEISGAGLAAEAIALDLVDEFRMFRNPIVVGGGTPYLPPVANSLSLELVDTRVFGARVVYERYIRDRASH
jgi:dihydrofolate reductase